MSDTNRLTESGNLEVRLAKLESQNQSLSRQVKRMRLVLFATVVLGLIGVDWVVVPSSSAMTQTRRGAGAQRRDPETIRAGSFVIVDREGVPRGSLGYNEQEQTTVLNLEPFKNGRINLAIGRENFALRMTHADKNDINFGYTQGGGTYLMASGKEGTAFFEQRKP